MAVFRMKIAGAVAEIQSIFHSTPQYFRAYLTEEKPDNDYLVVSSIDNLQFCLQFAEQTELDDRIFRNTKKVFLGELSVVLDMDIDFLEEEIMDNYSV